MPKNTESEGAATRKGRATINQEVAKEKIIDSIPADSWNETPPARERLNAETDVALLKAHESERKTVHQWLNDLGITDKELGNPICLLRRLRILCDEFYDRDQILQWCEQELTNPQNVEDFCNMPLIHGGFLNACRAARRAPLTAAPPKDLGER